MYNTHKSVLKKFKLRNSRHHNRLVYIHRPLQHRWPQERPYCVARPVRRMMTLVLLVLHPDGCLKFGVEFKGRIAVDQEPADSGHLSYVSVQRQAGLEAFVFSERVAYQSADLVLGFR